MFPAQRISLLKKIVKEKKSVDTATLCTYLDVSDVTVRKYLDALEQEGFLVKVHGGAILAPTYEEETREALPKYTIENAEAKEQIAQLALTLVEDGDNVFIGSGTTCFLFAKTLYKRKRITVVTNNINCIEELAPYVDRLFFIGGDVFYDAGAMYTYGNTVLSQLDGLYVSKAFFSVEGIDLHAGVTMDDSSRAEVIKKVAQSSTQTIIMADSSKFDKFGLHRICPIERFNVYVTDNQVPEKYKKYFFDNDIKLLTSYDI